MINRKKKSTVDYNEKTGENREKTEYREKKKSEYREKKKSEYREKTEYRKT